MDHNEYWQRLSEIRGPNQANLLALRSWTETLALPWLWDEVGGAVMTPRPVHPMASAPPPRRTLVPLNHTDAVRHGLIVSLTERDEKVTEARFYQAQLTMLDSEARRYCKAIDGISAAKETIFALDAVVNTLHRGLWDMLRYAHVLLEDAAREVTGVPGYYASGRRTHETAFEVYKGAEQSVYGTYSAMTHMDRAPYTPVAVLRTAIELRLRQAFGISGLVDPARAGDLVPIDMSKLFEAIRGHTDQIEFSVDVHDVWKIYRWSNFYLHGGVRDFPWVAGFLIQFLLPLFADSRTGPHGWNINGGIRMRRETWRAVRSALVPAVSRSTLLQRLGNAWRELFPRNRAALQLLAVDESEAQCVFLD